MLMFLMPPEVRRSLKSASLRHWVRTFYVLRYPRRVETPGPPRTHRSATGGLHGDAAELDRDTVDDGVLGVVERAPIVPAIDGDADGAGIDVNGVIDASRPLEVGVAAGEKPEPLHAPGRQILGVGKEDVFEMARRAVEGKELITLVRRRERADLVEVARLELRQRPLPLNQLLLADLLVRLGRDLEEKVVRIAQHDRPTELRQTVQDSRRLVASLRNVAEDDAVRDSESS